MPAQRRFHAALVLLLLGILACQPFIPPGPGPATRPPAPPGGESPGDPGLPPFEVDLTKPFAEEAFFGEPLTLGAWEPEPYAGTDYTLPLDLDRVANAQVLDGLTGAQRAFLARNGFVVIHSQEAQFGDIRVETARRSGQPYYLTADAAFHALHLLVDNNLKELERQYFFPEMMAVTAATLQEAQAMAEQVKGTNLEAEADQAVAYLSVALKLFDPQAQADAAQADQVARQVEQIMAADGRAKSALFPDFEDDYGAYRPVGHYAGDPELEAYFRAMTWYGRMHFRLEDPENPDFVPSRVPLIITLALRRAELDNGAASDQWLDMHRTLDFVIGPSDDAGPPEYAALMDRVYGTNPEPSDLADERLWGAFLGQSDDLPAPQVNSLFVDSTIDLSAGKGWRFMGQRFTLDGMIFQNMIFDRVQARPGEAQRDFPSGLDVMAAFGSAPAYRTLEELGETDYPNYAEQMSRLQQAVEAQPEAQWLGRFYDNWLYSFFPLLAEKGEAYPAYMQTGAWAYKDLNTALGSWAELKHDTALYTKEPERAGGGGPPMSGPAPSYVEPNPDAFYRMAYMCEAFASGLLPRLMVYETEGIYLGGLLDLGERFKNLGDIAARQLAGEALTEEDYDAITDCLGTIECMNLDSGYNIPTGEMPKPPVIAAVSGSDDQVLEVGVGWVDRLYAVVPLEGRMQVAQGGVFSYYEFRQPRDQRLTDEEWREMLAGGQAPALPSWASNFVLPGGDPSEWLAFRVGDVYLITEAGDALNARAEPSLQSDVQRVLQAGEYVEIVDGPVAADGYTWWQLGDWDGNPLGWAVEDQEWYERSYLP